MAVPNTRQRARELVQQIARDHGYLGKEKLQRIEPDLRREIEEAFLKKDLMIGSTVITLAKNLYTSKARFVFELLQNADDNSYTRATAAGSEPYVSFRVYPRRIVIECNEDGFNQENLKAICSVGKSSKTGAQGYIGEKGIGFKSVFMAAHKVHIQSGAFSFSFAHGSGESGMGMISPLWEDTDEQLPSPLTRITLHLHESGESDLLARTRQAVREQFEQLQETFLLFMKNLRRVDVSFYDEAGSQTSSAAYSIKRPRTNDAVLDRIMVAGGATQERTARFHVTTHQATNLARNENRTYSDAEEAGRAYAKSDIILAFPLSDTSVPVINPQELFVFLPVRKVGFSFLIQADFVTDASRQDVVRDSPRNIGLLDGIADAFAKAVLQFCEHDTLCYQWMRYLPDKKATHWGSLWLSLVNRISDKLNTTRVLYGPRNSDRRFIRDLVRLQLETLDESGQPLLDDGDPEEVTSRQYLASDLDLLSAYGLRYASFANLNKWLEQDLKRGTLSRMKSSETKEGWHSRVAKLLHRPFQKGWDESAAELKKMHLLPLQDGTWVTASSRPVYFSQVDGMDIPSDIDLSLISRNVTNSHRLTLFADLGVQTAPVRLIRAKIIEKYPLNGPPPHVSFASSKCHLQFLYLTHHLRLDGEPSYSRLAIHDCGGNLLRPRMNSIYLADDEPYHACELFKATDPGPNPGDGAPGYLVKYVHEDYFTEGPSTPPGQGLTWLGWFHEELFVEKNITLTDGDCLTEDGEYIQKHRPDRFLGTLRLGYEDGDKEISTDTNRLLRETEVLCQGDRQVKLSHTYFPVKELQRRVERYMEPGAFFPWLYLDASPEPHDAVPPEWKELLADLGVGIPSTDLDFALDMLRYSVDGFPSLIAHSGRTRLFNLYGNIHGTFWEQEDQSQAQEKIRNMFSSKKCIYIPDGADNCTWAFPRECVWEAPQELQTKFALELLYESCNVAMSAYSSRFFTDVLGIADSTWETCIDELKELKVQDCNDADVITTIYRALKALWSSIPDMDKDRVRGDFESNALVYAPVEDGPSWHKVSQCVWSSSATRLRGRVSLADDYGDLEDLFARSLGVKPVDLLMAIDELKEAGRRPSVSIADLKETIWMVNSLLLSEPHPPSSAEVVRSLVFPIRTQNGYVTRGSTSTEFFVVDREPLKQAFEAKVKLLDFGLEHVARLRPFLKWTRLEDRCLSHCIKEITSFHGGEARQTSNPERQIRKRAHALLRIASHFNSPRTQSSRARESFYEVLRNAEIYETGGISSDLHLAQDGTVHVVKGEKATLHIDDSASGGLKVYLPRNRADQDYMFQTSLGDRLFEWMMKDSVSQISEGFNEAGVRATRAILVVPRSRQVAVLDDNGISSIDVEIVEGEIVSEPESPSTPQRPSPAAGYETFTPSEYSDSDADIVVTPASSLASPLPSRHRAAAIESAGGFFTPAPARPRLAARGPLTTATWSLTPVSARPSAPDVSSNQQYVALLDRVISAARTEILPTYGAVNPMANLPMGDGGLDQGVRSASQIERDCKVGAAGELYVFEFLSYLANPLPEFSHSNWRSNVRRYVTVHPTYADMGPWEGNETADITYTDCNGVLTDLLVDKGYLARDDWAGRRPTYFIEVKTTTSKCDTPFYMSKRQYQRMQDNTLTEENRDTIYVIFRVYHLGRDAMGFVVYLDPEQLRVSGQLGFTAETWSVVPRHSVQ